MDIFKILPDPARNKIAWGAIFSLFMALAVYGIVVLFFVRDSDGLDKFFHDIEELGYIANRGLSGLYYPGNVIQVTEEGPGGTEQPLDPPIVLLWHTECFPKQGPKEKVFSSLRLTSDKAEASIQLTSKLLSKIFPVLQFDSNAVADYTLFIRNQRILAYSRGDLNKRFSEKCNRKIYEAIYEDGDKEHWIRVVLEALVADSLILELKWKTATSAESRTTVTEVAKQGLSDIVRNIIPRTEPLDVVVGLKSESEKKTVIGADGLVILAYRVRPIELEIQDQ